MHTLSTKAVKGEVLSRFLENVNTKRYINSATCATPFLERNKEHS